MALYSWGANSHGQLGLNNKCEEIRKPQVVSLNDVLPRKITSIEIGSNQTYLICEDGSVYGCGLNQIGQLGFGGFEELSFVKLKILEEYKVKQLSCKWDTCYAVTDDGTCIGWGANAFGQLGVSPKELSLTREPVIICKNVIQVAAGLRHCAILLSYGLVLTAGSRNRGQLGRPYCVGVEMFDYITDINNVAMIASGQNFSLAMTKEKKLYGWGCNKFGQLGISPDGCPFSNTPVQIFLSPPLTKEDLLCDAVIKCGWTHVLLQTGTKLFAWGRNSYGQLGNSDMRLSYICHPVEVLPEDKIKTIAAGAEHNLIVTEDGILKSWGWNEHGSCGKDNDTISVLVPTAIVADAKLIAAGSGHSFCLVNKIIS